MRRPASRLTRRRGYGRWYQSSPQTRRSESYFQGIKGIPVLQNVTISVCDHTAILNAASVDTTVNQGIATTAYCPLYCDYEVDAVARWGSLGPVHYWRPRTVLLCTACFLHTARMLPIRRPLADAPPSPVDLNILYHLPSITLHLPRTSSAMYLLARFTGVVLLRGCLLYTSPSPRDQA